MYQHLWNKGSIPKEYSRDDDNKISIHVITLSAHLTELAREQALRDGIEFSQVENRVNQLLGTQFTHAREFVEVTPNFICVGINCNWIDDSAISQALELVSRLDSFQPGTMIEIGELVQIYENKIPCSQRTDQETEGNSIPP